MNAEALIGTVLGTCTLQRLIGQGGMGAVFLAQQSRPRRQVAVKVLLPVTRLTPTQQASFLERFRRETDAAASLEHPNILPVHEYGERDGLAYLVTPYISGGTLRDELEREGQLPLVNVVNYLDQMAAALDVAHGHGVIHRDIKPANILKTDEGRLLLTDFGLVKIVADGQGPHVSLTGAGVPLGTPEYMSPEQVMAGHNVDARSDLYSLGVVLYQMVTGMTPFRGDMPMQIAMQHLHSAPVPPSSLRKDLPIPAEQVMLRALAKNPDERYASAQDLASALRLALAVSGIQLSVQNVGGSGPVAPGAESRLYMPRGLFDPSWQTANEPAVHVKSKSGMGVPRVHTPSLVPLTPRLSPSTLDVPNNDTIPQRDTIMPSLSEFTPPMQSISTKQNSYMLNNPSTPIDFTPPLSQSEDNTSIARSEQVTKHIRPRGVHKTGLMRPRDERNAPDTQVPEVSASFSPVGVPLTPNAIHMSERMQSFNPVSPFPVRSTDGTASEPISQPGEQAQQGVVAPVNNPQGATTTVKLTQSFKVIQVPVAGQPGQFVTGFLPVLPPEQGDNSSTPTSALPPSNLEPLLSGAPLHAFNRLKNNIKIVVLCVAVFLILLTSSAIWLLRTHTNTSQQAAITVTPNITATAGVQATATMQANTILSDPLSANSHNWHVATSGAQQFVFKDNAYHITNNDTKALALALLPDETISGSYVYSLTMQALSGDESTPTNQFGLVYNFNVFQKNGKTYKAFYIFEVANTKGGTYQLLKYDDSNTTATGPWTTVWSAPYGSEFHSGHGPKSINTFKVAINNGTFTLIVNNKVVGKAKDSSLKSGEVGMLVNLNKTEVAFSNLLLTYK